MSQLLLIKYQHNKMNSANKRPTCHPLNHVLCFTSYSFVLLSPLVHYRSPDFRFKLQLQRRRETRKSALSVGKWKAIVRINGAARFRFRCQAKARTQLIWNGTRLVSKSQIYSPHKRATLSFWMPLLFESLLNYSNPFEFLAFPSPYHRSFLLEMRK